jgi:hypothetical protein
MLENETYIILQLVIQVPMFLITWTSMRVPSGNKNSVVKV